MNNLFESDNGETRQQRLALTWSGKNEPEPAEMVEEPIVTDHPEADMLPRTEEPQVERQRPTLTLTKEAPVPKPESVVDGALAVENTVEERVEASSPSEVPEEETPVEVPATKPVLLLKTQTPVESSAVVKQDVVEDVLPMEADDSDSVDITPAPEPERTPMEEPIEATAEHEATPAANRTQAIQVPGATASEAATEIMDAVAVDEDAAAYARPAINPVEISDDFASDQEQPVETKDTIEMEQPKKVTLTKAAVIPDAEDEPAVSSPAPALTVTKDNDKTCSLKPKRPKNNTCKLKPDTSEIVADSLGGKLRAAREMAGLSEFELAEKTRISSEYISSLENEAFADLPLAPIYVKSYLKTLARQFALNADELIALYEEKTGELKAKTPAKKESTPKAAQSAEDDGNTSKWLNRSIAAAAAAILLLMIAGVLMKNFGGSTVTAEELQVITNDELCDSIRTTYLPARNMPIPGRESAAMNGR